MYDVLLRQLQAREHDPIDVIVVGLGFVSFGFLSSVRHLPGIRVPLILTRRPDDAETFLQKHGIRTNRADNPSSIRDAARHGRITVSDDLSLVRSYENDIVCEMTGTVSYGTQVALLAIQAKKHLLTMNPELQVTVGAELKILADKAGVLVSDAIGDQPGSIARLVTQSRLMGFRVLLAGNMKRYLNRHATQREMAAWAKDKGLAARQTVSFTDGTKQSIEMNLVSNYFGFDILQFGMRGPDVDTIHDSLTAFDWKTLPEEGVVDYCIGKRLFPGVFVVGEHTDPHQQPYLRYLGLGNGPRYVLFEPYHLCHLEVAGSIAKLLFYKQETINNATSDRTRTIAVAKRTLVKGDILDGIGGDLSYGQIDRANLSAEYLPMGLSVGAEVRHALHQDQPIKLSDVSLPDNPATRLAGFFPTPDPSFSEPPVSVQI